MNRIEGQWINLRKMTADDASSIVSWRNRKDVAQWLIQWEPLTVEKHLKWFEQAQQQQELLVMFVDKVTGEAFGAASIYNFDKKKTNAEWGRVCTAETVNNPFAVVEACYLMMRYGFEVLKLKRIYCGCSAQNESAVKLNQFLGFQQEGLRRKHLLAPEGYRDQMDFGLLVAEFEQRRAEIEQTIYKHQEPPVLDEKILLSR